MSVFNQNIGLTAVNNIGNGTIDALRLPANGSVLIEDFANRYQHLETPLQIFIEGNLNPDGTSRLHGDIQQAFTQAEKNISHLHRSSFPSTVSFESREDIEFEDTHRFEAATVNPKTAAQKSGGVVKINLREPTNPMSSSDTFERSTIVRTMTPPESLNPDYDSIISISPRSTSLATTPRASVGDNRSTF